MRPCARLCVVCLVKDSGQQGTGWVQGRGEGMPKGRKIVVFSFHKGGPVGLHVTQCVCVWVGGMDLSLSLPRSLSAVCRGVNGGNFPLMVFLNGF